MKKLLATLLALVMVLGMATTAFAVTGTNADTGSITIDKAHTGATYGIYQILKLESYDTSINSYIYTPVDAWKDWINDPAGGGKYLVVNDNGTVKWNGTATEAAAAAFVTEALAYAKAESIAPGATAIKANDSDVVKFENLNLGYYLVDSSIGALCSLDTVMPDTIIEEKNTPPGNDKKVLDSKGNWQEEITASIGKTVTFASKITVYPGTHNLAYHDKMDEGLTYTKGSVKVYYTPMADNILVADTNYSVVESGMTDECDFEVKFDDDFMATITETTQLTIVYEAVLNEKAVIADETNVNYSKLTYGDDGETEWDPAKVITYKFGIVKTDISNHVLEGAEFELYYSATGGDKIPLVKVDKPNWGEDGINYYRPATAEEQAADGFVSAKIEAGKACVFGIRAGLDMYLEETKAPEGYNKLSARHHITALTENNVPTYDVNGLYEKGGVEIENLAGAQLPQTGGMGTTLFYVFGALLVAAAVVLLVTKKRMTAEN